MKKLVALLLTVIMCFSLAACGGSNESDTLSVEEAYELLVTSATEGNYLEGWQVYQVQPELAEYEDASVYYNYCVAMRAYEAGGIGFAYDMLKNNGDILNTQDILEEIGKEIGNLNGIYKADNGVGSYLYLVIKDGKVATKTVGYNDDNQDFTYEDSELISTIVKSTYSDGTPFYAVGRYSTIGAELDVNYVMDIADDSIMMIKYETYEYDTFNGLYSKISEVQ